jgi:hypothetical protein
MLSEERRRLPGRRMREYSDEDEAAPTSLKYRHRRSWRAHVMEEACAGHRQSQDAAGR